MDKGKNGALGEAAVLKELIKQGYTVFTQFDGKSPFDLVAYKDNVLYRVSVKSATIQKGKGYDVELRQRGKDRSKDFDKSAADILAVYIVPEDKVVLLETSSIESLVKLRVK